MVIKNKFHHFGKRTALFFAIAVIIFLTPAITWLPYYFSNPKFLGPWLTWDDDPRTTIVINWWTPHGMKCRVLLWNETYKKTIESEGIYHHVKFTNLTPLSRYKYVISGFIDGKWVNVTKIYEFQTAPDTFMPFTVLVIADEQYHYPAYGATETALSIVKQVKGYNFTISLGDQVEEDTEVPWKRFFENLGDMAANKTFMPIAGNHEWREYRSNHAKMFLNLFALPGNGLWYAFNYSNTVFIALSLFDYENYTLPEQEIAFLNRTVENAKKAGMWVVVYFHIPALTIFSARLGDEEKVMKIVRLLTQLKVNLVLAGHTHAYCRFNVNGTYFINLPSVGGTPDFFAYDTEQTYGIKVQKWLFEFGYALIDFTDNGIHFVYKTIYGDVGDDIWIK